MEDAADKKDREEAVEVVPNDEIRCFSVENKAK